MPRGSEGCFNKRSEQSQDPPHEVAGTPRHRGTRWPSCRPRVSADMQWEWRRVPGEVAEPRCLQRP